MLADLVNKIFKKRNKKIIDNVNELAKKYGVNQPVSSDEKEAYDNKKMHEIVSNTINAIKDKITDDNKEIETVDNVAFQNLEDKKNDAVSDNVNGNENKNEFEYEGDIEILDFLDLKEEVEATKDESIIEEKSISIEESTDIADLPDYKNKNKKEKNEFSANVDDSVKSSNRNYYYIDKLLTYRQIEFMVLFVNGLSRSEISNYYEVAYDTVKKAIQDVKERLNLTDDYELIETFKKDYSMTLRYIDILEKYKLNSSSKREQLANSYNTTPEKKSEDDLIKETIYYLNDEKNKINKFAKARYIGDGTKKNNKIIVLPGSFMNKDVVITKKWLDCPWIEEARQDILLSNSVREIKNIYFFVEPFELNSPNLCACILLGYITTNAWNEWKDDGGNTLEQNFDRKLLQENFDMSIKEDDGRKNRAVKTTIYQKDEHYVNPFSANDEHNVKNVLLQSFKNGYHINSFIDFEKFKMNYENFSYAENDLNEYLKYYYPIYNDIVIILADEEINQIKNIIEYYNKKILSFDLLFNNNIHKLYSLRVYNIDMLKAIIQDYYPYFKYRDNYAILSSNLTLKEILDNGYIEFADGHIGEELGTNDILEGVANIIGFTFDNVKNYAAGPNFYKYNLDNLSKESIAYYSAYPKLFYQVKQGTYLVIGQDEKNLEVFGCDNIENQNANVSKDRVQNHSLPKYDEKVEKFINWAITQKNQLGTNFLERVIRRTYVYRLINCPRKLILNIPIKERDIFSITDLNKYKLLVEEFRNAPNYKNVPPFNPELSLYERYLQHLESEDE